MGIADGFAGAQFRALAAHGSFADLRALVLRKDAFHLVVHLAFGRAVKALKDKDGGGPGLFKFLGDNELVNQLAGHSVGVVEDHDVIQAV